MVFYFLARPFRVETCSDYPKESDLFGRKNSCIEFISSNVSSFVRLLNGQPCDAVLKAHFFERETHAF
jgi:hypothetical protein